MPPNSWDEYGKLILFRLDDTAKRIDVLSEAVVAIRKEMAQTRLDDRVEWKTQITSIKTRLTIWIGLGSVVVSVILSSIIAQILARALGP